MKNMWFMFYFKLRTLQYAALLTKENKQGAKLSLDCNIQYTLMHVSRHWSQCVGDEITMWDYKGLRWQARRGVGERHTSVDNTVPLSLHTVTVDLHSCFVKDQHNYLNVHLIVKVVVFIETDTRQLGCSHMLFRPAEIRLRNHQISWTDEAE